MNASKHATGSTGWTGFILLALAEAITIPYLDGRDASVMGWETGWETAWPFIWLTIGAMATRPTVTYTGEAIIRRWDWLTPTNTLLALCATIAIWGSPQGLMSGLSIAVFASMALAAEGVSAKWKYEIFLCLMAGLFMVAGVGGACVLLVAFGHFAACFLAIALAFTCLDLILRRTRRGSPFRNHRRGDPFRNPRREAPFETPKDKAIDAVTKGVH